MGYLSARVRFRTGLRDDNSGTNHFEIKAIEYEGADDLATGRSIRSDCEARR
jgi:hypothetical protein